MTKLTPDEAIDLAYDIFLEMAGENLDPADILLFNLQFEELGAKFLISHEPENREYHVVWKE